MVVQQTHPKREDSNRVKVIVSPVGRQGPQGPPGKQLFNTRSVEEFGAKGDGISDDTKPLEDALEYARVSGGGEIVIPSGTYLISKTLYIPSNTILRGEGLDLTVIKNSPDASLDLVIPVYGDDREDRTDIHVYKPMLCTDSADFDYRENRTEGSAIFDLTLDYNGVPIGGNSATELLVGRAVDFKIDSVRFKDCRPSDLVAGDTGINFGSCVAFAFSEDCGMSNCRIGAATYESVTVAFLSRRISFINNIFDVGIKDEGESQRHCFQIARPTPSMAFLEQHFGEVISGPVYLEGNEFVIGHKVSHAITSHSARGVYIKSNTFRASGTTRLGFVIKIFDGSSDCKIESNILDFSDLTTVIPNGFRSYISLASDATHHTVSENLEVINNTIHLNDNWEESTYNMPVVGTLTTPANSVVISGNKINIRGFGTNPLYAIGVKGIGNKVSDNVVNWLDPLEYSTEAGPAVLVVGESDSSVISNNFSYGEPIYEGIIQETGAEVTNFHEFSNVILNAATWDRDETTVKGVYGVTWDKTHAASEVTRIGDMDAHRNLPVQRKMRGCLVDDDGTVNYYLDANNWNLREDGQDAVLDGSHGQVMVEIPAHYRQFSEVGNIRTVLISLGAFEGGKYVPVSYMGAFEAAIHRPSGTLASVMNDTADYRGGNNNASRDDGSEFYRDLQKAATVESRMNFESLAEARGDGWHNFTYEEWKTIYWLMVTEYANRNLQLGFDPNPTVDGFKQGGLGDGPTGLSSSEWSDFNGQYPILPIGLTVELGNQSGEVPVTLTDFPTSGESRQFRANSYRGIENPWGHIWKWMSGVNLEVDANAVSRCYVQTGKKSSADDVMGYRYAGIMPSSSGYISDIIFGEEGDILPAEASGSSSTYHADYWWRTDSEGIRGLRLGGSASSGVSAGPVAVRSAAAPSSAAAYIGSRLAFSPS